MMKKLLLLLMCASFMQTGFAQNFIQSNMAQPTCFGTCDGSIVFSTTVTAGPFTATLSNSSSCSNAIQQSSTGNTITLTNLCACVGDYTVNFYNSANVLVGSELLQVPITATTPLVLLTPSINPAVCSTCCNGEVYVNWSGGYTPSPNNPTITIDAVNVGTASYPNASVCPGTHTICINDLAGCVVCTTFSMSYVTHVGMAEIGLPNSFEIWPNPASEKINLTYSFHSSPLQVIIYDLYGKMVLKETDVKSIQDDHTISILSLTQGIYFVELRNSESILIGRKKFIKLKS